MWEWQAPEGFRVYDELSQKVLEETFRSYAAGVRMRVGWFAAVPGRNYTVHMPSRKEGGAFKQQNMTTGNYRMVRRNGQELHVGYGPNIATSLWGLGVEDESAPPPPPPPPEPLLPPASSSLPRKWANPILTVAKSVDLSLCTSIPRELLQGPFVWKEEDSAGLEVTAVSQSKDGSEGVLFVQSSRGVFVLKGSATMAADLLANGLAENCFHLRVPATRVIHYGSKEYLDLTVRCLEQLVRQTGQEVPARPAKDWYLSHPLHRLVGLAGSAGRVFGMGFLAIMEFIPGMNCCKLEEKEVMGLTEQTRAARLGGIGAVVCLDLLTNNWDRLPLSEVWSHEGNLGNIMLTSEGVVAIDNSVTSITTEKAKQKWQAYLQRVWKVASEVFRCHELHKVSRCFADVRTALWAVNGFDIGDASLLEMQTQFITSCKAAALLTRVQLQTLRQEVKQKFLLTYMEVPDDSIGMNRVDLGFLQSMVELVFQPLVNGVTDMPHFSEH